MPKNPLEKTPEQKRENRKYGIMTLLNTLFVYGLYVVLMQTPYFQVALIVYLSVLALFSFGYVFYNRGFTRKNLTVEQLPESWSEEQKHLYLSDAEERVKKSKWCLTVIIPFVLTFLIDLFYLYILDPYFLSLFGDHFS